MTQKKENWDAVHFHDAPKLKWTRNAIGHPLTVYFFIAVICLAGVGVYTSLPRESFPEVEVPLVLVHTIYPGVSPTDMEAVVTRPIETEIKAVSGVKEMRSTTSEGVSIIEVEFETGEDRQEVLTLVREQVDLARPLLPAEAEEPLVRDLDFAEFPVMVATLSGPVGAGRLTDVAEEVQEDLETLAGVSQVSLVGGREREVEVQVDPKRLQLFELSLTDVVAAIARENRNVPGGEINIGGLDYLVRLPAEIRDPSQIEDFVVKVREGDPVFIRDVADVRFGFKDEETRSRVDREPAVTLTITKQAGANLVGVADLVNERLDDWDDRLPPGVQTAVIGDISVEIRRMVNELENNVISGLLLVVACLMAFVGLRNSFFVGVAIPFSMLLAFLAIGAIGYTLNMMVLFSLILMLGMLVDNAVVIVENIYRHREMGESGKEAALRATREVASPVIASTITTLCAFSPLLVWPGMIGSFMSYLPVTVIIGLSASLLVALIINPTLCAHLMRAPKAVRAARAAGVPFEAPPLGSAEAIANEHAFRRAYRHTLEWALVRGENEGSRSWMLRNWALPTVFTLSSTTAIVLAMGGMSTGASSLFAPAAALGGLALVAFLLQGVLWASWTLVRRLFGWGPYITDHRAGIIWAMGSLLFVTVGVYAFVGPGTELFPDVEPRQITINIDAPTGTGLESSNALVAVVEQLTGDTPDLQNQVASVGGATVGVNPGENMGGGRQHVSQVSLYLHERTERQQRDSFVTMEQVRAQLAGLVGADVKVDKPDDGPPTGAAVSVRIMGDDLDELSRLAEVAESRIRDVDGLVNLDSDIEAGSPEFVVDVNREEAMRAGVNTQIIAATVQTGVLGAEASKYRVAEDEHDIRVRLIPEARESLDAISELTVPDKDGLPVPIRTVASIRQSIGPAAVHRVDMNRTVTLEGDVAQESGRTDGAVRDDVAAEMEAMDWPPGYRWEFSGSNEEELAATAFLSRAFVIAVLLILGVLVTQFDSLVLPLVITSSVALSMIGVFWGLILTATPFGIIMTGIGVISLVGIVVNNAIVLLDFIRQLRRDGMSRREAVVTAGSIRLRPVLLTAITTVLGLIPLTVGVNVDFFNQTITTGGESSQFWSAMGVAVIFGLCVSTALTLIVVPVMYDAVDGSVERFGEWRRSRKQAAAALNPAG